MILLEAKDINAIIHKLGLQEFYVRLMDNLTEDFKKWHLFQKCNRHAMYVDNGVIELMPICDDKLYSFKYVNGHPLNPQQGKLNIIALGGGPTFIGILSNFYAEQHGEVESLRLSLSWLAVPYIMSIIAFFWTAKHIPDDWKAAELRNG